MTLHISGEDVRRLVTHEVAMRAARAVVQAQLDEEAVLPTRLDIDLPRGFLRLMPAALGSYMGLKMMTLAKAEGSRYLILVYSQETGELVAAIDAAEVTRLRTAATTMLAAEILRPEGTDSLGLIGSGWEAEGHLRAFTYLWPITRVTVYSPNQERRESFAERMSNELEIAVVPADSAAEAVATPQVSLLCTKSEVPVLDGESLPAGATVMSIGSTRPVLRELDEATMRRSAILLADDPAQVISESGDVAAGLESGALTVDSIVGMHEWNGAQPAPGRDILTFKSVGTALQDLALAAELLEAAAEQEVGRDLGELAALKPFASTRRSAGEAV